MRRRAEVAGRARTEEAVDIDAFGNPGGGAVDYIVDPADFAGRDEAEMARRQGQCGVGRKGAEHGQTRQMARYGVGQQCAVPLAADAVEDDASDRQFRPVFGKAAQQGGGRGALPARVDDEHDGPAGHHR